MLIIDSPRKAFGANEADKQRATKIYDRFRALDGESYLPIVNGQSFESLQASGGGIATSVNVAYSLILLMM